MGTVTKLRDDDDESNKRITVFITTERIWESWSKDLLTVFTVCAPIALNELTIQSSFMNFCLGAMFLFMIAAMMLRNINGDRRIRGRNADDVCAKLRTRIARFEESGR